MPVLFTHKCCEKCASPCDQLKPDWEMTFGNLWFTDYPPSTSSMLISGQRSVCRPRTRLPVYFQLHGTRRGCHLRIVVFVHARLEGSHSDRILSPQTEFHLNSVARSERIKVKNRLRSGETELGKMAAGHFGALSLIILQVLT